LTHFYNNLFPQNCLTKHVMQTPPPVHQDPCD